MKISLKNLHEASLQDIFNQVKEHMLKQGEACLSTSYGCSYRNSKGLKCAVGCLISDEEYSHKFEDKNLGNLLEYFKETGIFSNLRNFSSTPQYNLLYELQRIHDVKNPRYWEALLKELAKDFKIDYE